MQIRVPQELRGQLSAEMGKAGIGGMLASEQEWAEAEHALKQVWASKFNERAYVR